MRTLALYLICMVALAALTASPASAQTAAPTLPTADEMRQARQSVFDGMAEPARMADAVPTLERYAAALVTPATQAEAEQMADPWLMLQWLNLALQRLGDTGGIDRALPVDRRYYGQKGAEAFQDYFHAVKNACDLFVALGDSTRLEATVSQLEADRQAANDHTNASLHLIIMRAMLEHLRGNTSAAIGLLEQMRREAAPFMAAHEHDNFRGSNERHDALLWLTQNYWLAGQYSRCLPVLDDQLDCAGVRYAYPNSREAIALLCDRATLLQHMGRRNDLLATLSRIDSLCALPPAQGDGEYIAAVRQQTAAMRDNLNPLAQNQQNQVALDVRAYEQMLDSIESQPAVGLPWLNQQMQLATNALLGQSQFAEALRLLDRNERIILGRMGQWPGATRMVEACRGAVFHRMGDLQQAQVHLERAYAMFCQAGDYGQHYQLLVSEAANFCLDLGDLAYAKLYVDELARIIDGQIVSSADAPLVADYARAVLALYYERVGYAGRGLQEMDKFMAMVAEQGYDTPALATHKRIWATLMVQSGQAARAIPVLRQLLGEVQSPADHEIVNSLLMFSLAVTGSTDAFAQQAAFNDWLHAELAQTLAAAPAFDRLAYWQSRTLTLNCGNNFLLHTLGSDARAAIAAYDNALYVKSQQDKQLHDCPRWTDIRSALGAHEAAIEFVAVPVSLTDNSRLRYGALVLRHDSRQPQYVDLCPTEQLDQLFLSVVHTDTAHINRLYDTHDTRLHRLLWQKLEPWLSPGDTVYYSPVGMLARVNHAAIGDGTARLESRYDIQQVSTTALVGQLHRRQAVQGRAVIYGGIEYDLTDDEMLAAASRYAHPAEASPAPAVPLPALPAAGESQLFAMRSLSGTRGAVDVLTGTLAEAENIHALLTAAGQPAELLTGAVANEESLKSLSGHAPTLLHIGTHGFLLSNSDDVQQHRPLVERTDVLDKPQQTALLYSGLLFAGANRAWRGEPVPEGVDDGILTAYELSQLDLTGCRLAVLSACETGLGFVNNSYEDERGLKYALKLAGVGSIIASLWEVPDEPTALLMDDLYARLAAGDNPRQALVHAQRKLRAAHPQPYFWAGFYVVD